MFSSGGVRPGQARLGKVRLPHHEITEIMMSAESGKFYWFGLLWQLESSLQFTIEDLAWTVCQVWSEVSKTIKQKQNVNIPTELLASDCVGMVNANMYSELRTCLTSTRTAKYQVGKKKHSQCPLTVRGGKAEGWTDCWEQPTFLHSAYI